MYNQPKKAKRDRNQPAITDTFRVAGYVVFDTSALGVGFPDMVVANPANGMVTLIEVKTDDVENLRKWSGAGLQREVEFMVSMVSDSYRITASSTGVELLQALQEMGR